MATTTTRPLVTSSVPAPRAFNARVLGEPAPARPGRANILTGRRTAQFREPTNGS